jgi:hypothetical protein
MPLRRRLRGYGIRTAPDLLAAIDAAARTPSEHVELLTYSQVSGGHDPVRIVEVAYIWQGFASLSPSPARSLWGHSREAPRRRLITGVQAAQRLAPDRRHPELRIDAIGGAWAGAITAVLAACAVTAGLDPVEMMLQAWVRQDSVDRLLKSGGLDSPLSMDKLAKLAPRILNPPGPRDPDHEQKFPVKVHLSLSNLRGLNYKFLRLRTPDPLSPADPGTALTDSPISASTYLDRDSFTLEPGANGDASSLSKPEGRSPVDTGLASGANPLGHAPRRFASSVPGMKMTALTTCRTTARPCGTRTAGRSRTCPLAAPSTSRMKLIATAGTRSRTTTAASTCSSTLSQNRRAQRQCRLGWQAAHLAAGAAARWDPAALPKSLRRPEAGREGQLSSDLAGPPAGLARPTPQGAARRPAGPLA